MRWSSSEICPNQLRTIRNRTLEVVDKVYGDRDGRCGSAAKATSRIASNLRRACLRLNTGVGSNPTRILIRFGAPAGRRVRAPSF